jgi:hypothetical protein
MIVFYSTPVATPSYAPLPHSRAQNPFASGAGVLAIWKSDGDVVVGGLQALLTTKQPRPEALRLRCVQRLQLAFVLLLSQPLLTRPVRSAIVQP